MCPRMRLVPRVGWVALACTFLFGVPASAREGAGQRRASPEKNGGEKPGKAPAKKPPAKKPAPSKGSPRKSPKRRARSPKSARPPEFPEDAGSSRATTASRLGLDECHAELATRGIRVAKLDKLPGIDMPVRLLGPVGGVVYRSDYPDAQRPTLPFEVFDCRLVVALGNFAPILRQHDIAEVRIFSAYRPPPRSTPVAAVRTGHPGGLAADLRAFIKESGARLEVLKDFRGQIGADPCGSGTAGGTERSPKDELRAIFCAGARARLFHLMLSPNYDRPHRNHFHLEVRPDVRWFIVR